MVSYNAFTQRYRIHSLYRDFLREQAFSDGAVDTRDIYLRLGEWYLKKKDFLTACDYLYQAGDVERVLQELNKEDMPDIRYVQYRKVNRFFENPDSIVWQEYPIAYLKYLRIYIASGGVAEKNRAAGCLNAMSVYFRNLDGDRPLP